MRTGKAGQGGERCTEGGEETQILPCKVGLCTYQRVSCMWVRPHLLYQVHFVGEEAIDTGGPSGEFWRLFVQGVANSFCVGDSYTCLPTRNIPALQVCGDYCTLLQIKNTEPHFRVVISR